MLADYIHELPVSGQPHPECGANPTQTPSIEVKDMHYSFNTVKTEHIDNLPIVMLYDIFGIRVTVSIEIFYQIMNIYVHSMCRSKRLPKHVEYSEIDSTRTIRAEYEHIGNRDYITISNEQNTASFPVDFLIEIYRQC